MIHATKFKQVKVLGVMIVAILQKYAIFKGPKNLQQ